MTDLKIKIAGGVATGALLAGVLAPAGAFASTVKVKHNGYKSHNKVKISNENKSNVKQENETAVVNLVGVLQNTGGNKANKNTKGTVSVNSGSATSNVTTKTTTGGNQLDQLPCDVCNEENNNDKVVIKGNGSQSHNHVNITNTSSSSVTQSNATLVVNGVLVGQNTGLNSASQNTGGDVDVDSGNASSTVTNTTTTGGNSL